MFNPDGYGKTIYKFGRKDAFKVKKGFISSIKKSRKVILKDDMYAPVVNFFKLAVSKAYNIGEHVTFMLVVEGHHTVQQVSKMRHFKQIKEYEELCANKGIHPLVSVKSGKGIIDYTSLLVELMDVYKELKRRYKSGEPIREKKWFQFWR